jgi:hypothetical protein
MNDAQNQNHVSSNTIMPTKVLWYHAEKTTRTDIIGFIASNDYCKRDRRKLSLRSEQKRMFVEVKEITTKN